MGITKEDLLNKIELHMRAIQDLMEENIHLDDPEYVKAHIDSIMAYWTYLDEGDKEYLDAVNYAIERKMRWSPTD